MSDVKKMLTSLLHRLREEDEKVVELDKALENADFHRRNALFSVMGRNDSHCSVYEVSCKGCTYQNICDHISLLGDDLRDIATNVRRIEDEYKRDHQQSS